MADICGAMLRYIKGGDPDLTMRQMALLGLIVDTPGQSVKPLADIMGVQKPVITRGANMLTDLGLVTRTRPEDDGRKVQLIPTDAGCALRERLRAA